MAFELIATGSKKWADYQQQNNPLAAGYNVIKAKGMDFVGINGQPATFNLVVTYTKATPLFEISDNELSANEVEYYNVRVVDESGNEAVGQLDVADPSTPVAIDISNLNVNEVLTAFVSIGSSYSPQLREMPNIEFVKVEIFSSKCLRNLNEKFNYQTGNHIAFSFSVCICIFAKEELF